MGTILSASEIQYTAFGSGNSGFGIIAKKTGITLALINPGGTNATTTVPAPIGLAYVVNLRTSAGTILATAEEVRAAIAKGISANAANDFVDVFNLGDGSGVVIAKAATALYFPPSFPTSPISPNPGEVVRAGGGVGTEFVIYGNVTNGDVRVIALIGNVRLRMLGGTSTTLDVTVNGADVTVQLGTNGGGTVTSTAADVVNEINGDVATSALVSSSFGGDGSGLASVLTDFMSISAGPIGSIRPPLETLTSRSSWLKLILKSFQSFRGMVIDGVGGLFNDANPGELNIRKANALPTPLIRFTFGKLIWVNTDTEANPATSYTPASNELCALNVCKAWVSGSTDGAGNFTITDSWNIGGGSVDAPGVLSFSFRRAMASSNYVVFVTGKSNLGNPMFAAVNTSDKSTSAVSLNLSATGGINLSAAVHHVEMVVFGRQNG